MPDTSRTRAELVLLLEANGIGAIGSQDLRDLLVSLAPVYGECSISSAAATAIGASSTFTLLAGTTVVGELLGAGFSHASPGRLTYLDTPDRLVSLRATLSVTHAADGEELRFRFAINGTTLARSEVRVHKVTGAQVEPVSLEALATLSTGDYVEVYVSNESSDADPTAVAMNLQALGGLR